LLLAVNVDVSATSAVKDTLASVSVVDRFVLSNSTTAFLP